MIEPFFHRVVMFYDGLQVPEPFVEHLRNDDIGTGPRDVVVVDRPVIGRDVRERTVPALRILDVLQPLGIEQAIVEDITFTERSCRPVAQPALALVTLGAIGRHAAVIRANTPVSVPVDPVDRRIRGRKTAGRSHPVVNHPAFEIRKRRRSGIPGDFDIAEPVVGESGFPQMLPFVRNRIGVGNLRFPEVVHI